MTDTDSKAEVMVQLQRVASDYKPINEWHRSALFLLGIFMITCCAFGSYIFNITSDTMSKTYGFTRADITVISTCGNVFGYAVLPYSLVYDYFGPLPIAVLSIFIFPLGALLMGLTFQGVITGTVIKLCVFYTFMNLGTTLYDLVTSMTVLAHYPISRGLVVAVLKSSVGIGGAIVGSIFVGLFNRNVVPMLYTLMGFALALSVVYTIVLRLPGYYLTGFDRRRLSPEEQARRAAGKAAYLRQRPPLYRFIIALTILITLILYLPITSAISAYMPSVGKSRKATLAFAIVTLVLLVSYVLVALPYPGTFAPQRAAREAAAAAAAAEKYGDRRRHDGASGEEPFPDDEDDFAAPGKTREGDSSDAAAVTAARRSNNDASSSLGETATVATLEDLEKTEVDFIAPQYQTSFWRNLLSIELWCLWWSIFVLVGTEMLILNNSGAIFAAFSEEPVSQDLNAMLTVINGIGSAVGRLAMSLFETWSQHKPAERRIPITVSLFVPSVSVLISLALMLALPAKALPLPYATSAFGNGFLGSLQLIITQTIYAKDVAKHYHWCFLATAFSSILINRFLFGEYYTRRARRYGALTCLHRDCAQVPMLVCVGLSASAIITNVTLHVRYWLFSRRVLAERARLRAERLADAADDDDNNNNNNYSIDGEPRGDALYDPLREEEGQVDREGKGAGDANSNSSSKSNGGGDNDKKDNDRQQRAY